MVDANTTESIFRFTLLRPPKAVAEEEAPSLESTELAKMIGEAQPRDRPTIAREFFAEHGGESDTAINSAVSRLLRESMGEAGKEPVSVADFKRTAGERIADRKLEDQATTERQLLSNLLVASRYASRPFGSARDIGRLYRAHVALRDDVPNADVVSLEAYLRRPMQLPATLRAGLPGDRVVTESQPTVADGGESGATEDANDEGLGKALSATLLDPGAFGPPWTRSSPANQWFVAAEELARLDRYDLLHHAGWRHPNDPPASPASLSLIPAAMAQITPATSALLQSARIDLSAVALSDVIQQLDGRAIAGSSTSGGAVVRRQVMAATLSSETAYPLVQPAGIAELLIVKQHLKRYQRMDIAHVENVLAGETKTRTHRSLSRLEDVFTTERETTNVRETELETADRFEMNRETSNTQRRDQRFGFGLTLSGKYGPTVDFSSNAQLDVQTATENTSKSAVTYAKDVVERSLERITERVREEQVRRIIREEEETNLHTLTNPGPPHMSGVYQFLEKVYESQVFNYGERMMFDVMVPEPASYLWHIEASPTNDLELPAPPPKLEADAPDAAAITPLNYLRLAARYGVTGITQPPARYIASAISLEHGATEGDEEGQPRSVIVKEVAVPGGYRPYRVVLGAMALTDADLTLFLTVGRSQSVWEGGTGTAVGSGFDVGAQTLTMSLLQDSYPFEEQGKLPIQVMAFESNLYAVTAEVLFVRTEAAYGAWQIQTYNAIADAYRNAVLRYEQDVEQLRAAAAARAEDAAVEFGSSPSQNRVTIHGELKKHCVSIFTRQRYENFNATTDGDPPTFDFGEAATEGSFVRFFEQAFEWDQLQYVCYPYFWARGSTWAERFTRQDVDPFLLEFLQAGQARVVIPVRPGFEVAVCHFLDTLRETGVGVIWNGEGDPPAITSPLYLPIVTEIAERSGAPQGEVAVGEPWDTIMPTPLVILRQESTLPKWKRDSPDGWDWSEV